LVRGLAARNPTDPGLTSDYTRGGTATWRKTYADCQIGQRPRSKENGRLAPVFVDDAMT